VALNEVPNDNDLDLKKEYSKRQRVFCYEMDRKGKGKNNQQPGCCIGVLG
jgi:hypothetical protein